MSEPVPTTTPAQQMPDPDRMRAALEEIVRLDARWTGQPAAGGDLVVESNAYNAKVVGRLGRIALAALLYDGERANAG